MSSGPWLDERLGENQAHLGQGADVEVDHAELFVEIAFGRPAKHTIAGVIDDDIRRCARRRQLLRQRRNCAGFRQIAIEDQRARVFLARQGGQRIGQGVERRAIARHQRQIMSRRRRHAGELGADAAGRAGNQHHFSSGVGTAHVCSLFAPKSCSPDSMSPRVRRLRDRSRFRSGFSVSGRCGHWSTRRAIRKRARSCFPRIPALRHRHRRWSTSFRSPGDVRAGSWTAAGSR